MSQIYAFIEREFPGLIEDWEKITSGELAIASWQWTETRRLWMELLRVTQTPVFSDGSGYLLAAAAIAARDAKDTPVIRYKPHSALHRDYYCPGCNILVNDSGHCDTCKEKMRLANDVDSLA